jgi:hypothetical protein
MIIYSIIIYICLVQDFLIIVSLVTLPLTNISQRLGAIRTYEFRKNLRLCRYGVHLFAKLKNALRKGFFWQLKIVYGFAPILLLSLFLLPISKTGKPPNHQQNSFPIRKVLWLQFKCRRTVAAVLKHYFEDSFKAALAASNTGHRVRLQNRSSRVRIPRRV